MVHRGVSRGTMRRRAFPVIPHSHGVAWGSARDLVGPGSGSVNELGAASAGSSAGEWGEPDRRRECRGVRSTFTADQPADLDHLAVLDYAAARKSRGCPGSPDRSAPPRASGGMVGGWTWPDERRSAGGGSTRAEAKPQMRASSTGFRAGWCHVERTATIRGSWTSRATSLSGQRNESTGRRPSAVLTIRASPPASTVGAARAAPGRWGCGAESLSAVTRRGHRTRHRGGSRVGGEMSVGRLRGSVVGGRELSGAEQTAADDLPPPGGADGLTARPEEHTAPVGQPPR